MTRPQLEQRFALHGFARVVGFEALQEVIGRWIDVRLDGEPRDLLAQPVDLLLLLRLCLASLVGVAFRIARGALRVGVGGLLAAHVVIERLECLIDLGVRCLQRVHLRGRLGLLTTDLVAIGTWIVAAIGRGDHADEYGEQAHQRGHDGHGTSARALRVGRTGFEDTGRPATRRQHSQHD